MNPTTKRATIALLASSLLLTIGRGATLPFMTIYLTRQYAMTVDKIGYAMSIALVVGVIFSLGFGILADKFDKKRYMLISVLLFIVGFVAIPLVHSVTLVIFFFSLINCTYSVFATVLKAYFSDTLSSSAKTRAFSLNYTILNMGWTVGPPIGTMLVMYSINLPFWLAAICAAFPLFFIQRYVERVTPSTLNSASTTWSPSVLLHDRALLWFTLSGLLASFVGGAFASCLSQYVLVIGNSEFAEQVVAVILPVNAAVVVTLQYAVGRKLTAKNLRPLMTLGTVCFVLGLAGFMLSGDNLVFWGLSAVIFTLGEIVYAPGEYMLIDNIAPRGMKASYFSAQSLGWLGAALNPFFTGQILTHLPPITLFPIMMAAIVLAWVFIFRGIKASSWQPILDVAR